MIICIKCGHKNTEVINYCSKCNSMLPKIGMDRSIKRGFIKCEDEGFLFANSGLYRTLTEILDIYREENINSNKILEILDETCDEIYVYNKNYEEYIKDIRKNQILPEDIKELITSSINKILNGLDLMMEAYKKTIELISSNETDIDMHNARKADELIINGKENFLNIKNNSTIFKSLKNFEDIFYKKKSTFPENLYDGDHVSFDI